MEENKVSLTQKDLFKVLADYKSEFPPTKPPSYEDCFTKSSYILQVKQDSADWNDFFKSSWMKFHRIKSKNEVKRKGLSALLDHADKTVRLFDAALDSREVPVLVPKKRKLFMDLGSRMMKERTDSLLSHIDGFVQRECPELSTTQLLGYMLHRINLKSNKVIAKVGHDILTDTLGQLHEFSIDEAIAVMHDFVLSKEQMRRLRTILSKKGIYFPTSNELLEGRKKLRPTITTILDNRGVTVSYKDVVQMTVESTLNHVTANGLLQMETGALEMVFKDGGDGAGQQVVWKSKKMIDAKENMFQWGITPLKLIKRFQDGSSATLWQNHSPNSCKTLRPLFLIRQKETDEDLLKAVIPSTDKCRTELEDEGLCAKVGRL